MKLSFKVGIVTSLVAIAVVMFLFVNIHDQLTTTAKKTAIEDYKTELSDIKHKTELLLESSKKLLGVIGVINSKVKNHPKKLKEKLEFYMKKVHQITSLKYISLKGDVLADVSNNKLFIKTDLKNYKEDEFFKILKTNDYYISDIYFSEKTNDMMIDIATKVLDVRTDTPTGILYAKITMNQIQELIIDNLINFDAFVLLDMNKKDFIYKNSYSNKFDKDIFLNSSTKLESIKTVKDEYIMVSDIYHNDNLKIKFFVLKKENKLFADINNTLKENLLLLSLIILISTIAVTIIVTKLLKPVTKLTNTIIKRSNSLDPSFSKNINVENSDELESIELYFDEFTRLLEADREKLNEFNKDLEKKVKEEVEKSKKKDHILFEQSKLASMGEMIANIAHQWRQPLSVISTGATGLKMQNEYKMLNDHIINETCDTIDTNAQYLSKTIDDFKNFIKGERKKEPFDLNHTMDSFLNLMIPSIKRHHIKLSLDLDDDLKMIGFENQLQQCLINIFNNAKDVLKEHSEADRFIFINAYKSQNMVTIKIKDSGGGIPEDIIEKIFDPYFTTKEQSQGTGLGLHMSHNLITNGMYGSIKVQNENFTHNNKEYTGALFTIVLPKE